MSISVLRPAFSHRHQPNFPGRAAAFNQTLAGQTGAEPQTRWFVALAERVDLGNIVQARRVLVGVIPHPHLVLAVGVVAGAQVKRRCDRYPRRGPQSDAQVRLEFAVGVDVRVEQDIRLVARVGHVHRHAGLRDHCDVNASSDGEPVVELAAERKRETRCGQTIAQLLEVQLVREVLFPLVGKKPLFVHKAVYRQKTVEAEDQVLPGQRADQAHDRIDDVVVLVGIAARAGQIDGCHAGRRRVVDRGWHVHIGTPWFEANLATRDQAEEAGFQLEVGHWQQCRVEVGSRCVAGKETRGK